MYSNAGAIDVCNSNEIFDIPILYLYVAFLYKNI